MSESERVISAVASTDEVRIDRAIRPHTLADYVGQPAVREQMSIAIEAARRRKDALDHVLLFGPPGPGKPTLAHSLSAELGGSRGRTSVPVRERAGVRGRRVRAVRPAPIAADSRGGAEVAGHRRGGAGTAVRGCARGLGHRTSGCRLPARSVPAVPARERGGRGGPAHRLGRGRGRHSACRDPLIRVAARPLELVSRDFAIDSTLTRDGVADVKWCEKRATKNWMVWVY